MTQINFFLGLFFNSQKVIESIQPRILELEKEIKSIEAMDNKVEAVVRYFQVITPIQDGEGFRQEISTLCKYDAIKSEQQIEALLVLQRHFSSAERSDYGIIRTEKGEEISASNVYIGNIFGFWEDTAAYWLDRMEELKKTPYRDSRRSEKIMSSWQLINDYHCGHFMKIQTDSILKQIAILKAVN